MQFFSNDSLKAGNRHRRVTEAVKQPVIISTPVCACVCVGCSEAKIVSTVSTCNMQHVQQVEEVIFLFFITLDRQGPMK